MHSDLHLALSNPTELISSLYASSSLDNLESRVSSYFKALFDPETLAQVPALTVLSGTDAAHELPAPGTLVRFRAMVQDTGFGSEVYKAIGSTGELLMYGKEEINAAGEPEVYVTPGDYANLRERQAFYVVSVPGETRWLKEKLDRAGPASLQNSLAAMSLSQAPRQMAPNHVTPSGLLANKFPVPSEPNFGCIAKVYGPAAEGLKTCDVCEFVGIMGETSVSTPFDDLVQSTSSDQPIPSAPTFPALHVIFAVPPSNPVPPFHLSSSVGKDTNAEMGLRAELLEFLASGLGGDVEAAEWVLLALLGRIHTRHPSGSVLGQLTLGLSLPLPSTTSVPTSSFFSLPSILEALVPTYTTLPLSIAFLNSLENRLAPRNKDENLESGRLQLAPGTVVGVDLIQLGEGVLGDHGVRNLRHLGTTMATQKVSYEFPYSAFELDCDLTFIVWSEGKALVETDCVVYVTPSLAPVTPVLPSEETLDRFRAFITTMRQADFRMPAEMSEIIQEDFVQRRQKSSMTQEDLLFRMTSARLMALSCGQTALGKEVWNRTADLDESRKARIARLGGPTVAKTL